jgi:hypothetical protein
MENTHEKIRGVVEVLELIQEKLKSPEINVLHSRFATIEDLITELDSHILKLQREDFSIIEELIILFAPTSDLQEISIDSGWGQLFLDLSKRFDSAIKELIEEFKVKLF